MDIETLKLLANMGFPAVVAGFLLFRLNGRLDRLRESLDNLAVKIDRLIDRH